MTSGVLLTGASGFVGRQVLRSLVARGAEVTVVARPASAARLEAEDGVRRVVTTADAFAEPASWWAQTCEGMECVVHAAWHVEPGAYLDSPRNLDCLTGTLALARGAIDAGVRRFVGVGTCFEYDLASGEDLQPTSPLRPLTAYAGAKAATFMALSQILPLHDISFAWCRLFYLFGEGEDSRRLVPYVRSRIAAGLTAELTKGDQVRDFMDVRDAGDAIAACALSDVTGAINVCSGVAVTVRQMVEMIADEFGRRDLLAFGARPDNLLDPPRVVGVPTRLA